MKKILLSALTIGVVAVVAVGATQALFTDEEVSTGNTFTAGTIDIAVDDENPWESSGEYVLEDMKPSYTDYIDFVIENVGTNPADVWKTLAEVVTEDYVESEPECDAEGGSWDVDHCDGGTPVDDIDTVIGYDLSVELLDDGGVSRWNQRLYNDDVMISTLAETPMYLGMIPAGWSMKVHQSYHMDDAAGNEYQGDRMTFNIDLDAQQLLGGVRGAVMALENKTGDPDWDIIIQGDGMEGTLNYTVMSPEFDFSFVGNGLATGTTYALVIGDNPWDAGQLLGTGVAAGGVVNISESVELGQNYDHAKVWLILNSDWDDVSHKMSGWHGSSYLFETGLIEYRDTDL